MRQLLLFILLFVFGSANTQVIFGISRNLASSGTGIDYTKINVFVGDSFTSGYNVLSSERYTTLFCAGKGGTEDNDGVSGQGIQSTGSGCGSFVVLNTSAVPVYNSAIHGVLHISLGVNDVMRNDGSYNATSFKTNYTTDVQFLITTKLWPPNKIWVYSPWKVWNYNIPTLCGGVNSDLTRINQYNTATQEVAGENGCWYINVYSLMSSFIITDYQADQIHLNSTGNSKLASGLLTNLNDLTVFGLLVVFPTTLAAGLSKKSKVISLEKNKAA
jgi:lysophospholipase L1-like esterase